MANTMSFGGPPQPSSGNSTTFWVGGLGGSSVTANWVDVNEPTMTFCPAHELGSDLQVVDGKAVGRCIRCQVPVTVPAMPGGVSQLRLQALIERYLAVVGCPNPARAIAECEILGDFARLSRELDAQLRALDAVKITLDTLRRRLGQLAMPVME